MTRSELGSITDLGGGRWYVRVSGGRNKATGKRIRLTKTVRGTRRDAERVKMQLLVEVGRVKDIQQGMTFGEFVDDVYLPRKHRQVENGEYRPNSYERVKDNLHRNAKPLWDMPLEAITAYHIEGCIADCKAQSMKHHTYCDVRMVWNRAIAWGFVPKDRALFDSVEKPKKPEPKIVTAGVEQLLDIFETFRGSRIEALVLLMAGCGLRLSEACGVDWEFIDFEQGEVKITRGYHRIKRKNYFLPPKTVAAGSSVSIPDSILARLFEMSHNEDGELAKRGAVAVMATGERFYPKYASEVYRKISRGKITEWEFVCMKNLRHSHATILLLSGEDIALVSKRLRHSNLATTYLKYIKAGKAGDRHSSNVFDEAIRIAQKSPNPSHHEGNQPKQSDDIGYSR